MTLHRLVREHAQVVSVQLSLVFSQGKCGGSVDRKTCDIKIAVVPGANEIVLRNLVTNGGTLMRTCIAEDDKVAVQFPYNDDAIFNERSARRLQDRVVSLCKVEGEVNTAGCRVTVCGVQTA